MVDGRRDGNKYRSGSLSLAEYPGDFLELACRRCPRRDRLLKSKLIAEYGPEICLPDLRHQLVQCERHGRLGDVCGAHFPALATANKT